MKRISILLAVCLLLSMLINQMAVNNGPDI